jgi:hypothetical protein
VQALPKTVPNLKQLKKGGNMTTVKKYQSPFKRVATNKNGGETIKKIQLEFDQFWNRIHRSADRCPEKFHAIQSLQEACMWLCRATALNHPMGEETQLELTREQRDDEIVKRALEKAQEERPAGSQPTIIIKKKKV